MPRFSSISSYMYIPTTHPPNHVYFFSHIYLSEVQVELCQDAGNCRVCGVFCLLQSIIVSSHRKGKFTIYSEERWVSPREVGDRVPLVTFRSGSRGEKRSPLHFIAFIMRTSKLVCLYGVTASNWRNWNKKDVPLPILYPIYTCT